MKTELKEKEFYPVFIRVAEAFKANPEIKDIAEKFGVSRQVIYDFIKDGFPKERLKEVEVKTGRSRIWLEHGVDVSRNSISQIPLLTKEFDFKNLTAMPNGTTVSYSQQTQAQINWHFKCMKEFLKINNLEEKYDEYCCCEIKKEWKTL